MIYGCVCGGGGQPFPPYSLNDPPRREAQQPQNAANPIRAQEMICLVVFFLGRARENVPAALKLEKTHDSEEKNSKKGGYLKTPNRNSRNVLQL
jgi:hypothetical protein